MNSATSNYSKCKFSAKSNNLHHQITQSANFQQKQLYPFVANDDKPYSATFGQISSKSDGRLSRYKT